MPSLILLHLLKRIFPLIICALAPKNEFCLQIKESISFVLCIGIDEPTWAYNQMKYFGEVPAPPHYVFFNVPLWSTSQLFWQRRNEEQGVENFNIFCCYFINWFSQAFGSKSFTSCQRFASRFKLLRAFLETIKLYSHTYHMKPICSDIFSKSCL